MDLIGHLIGPLVPELETTPTRELHRQPDQHFRSLLAQFGLTPKSRRELVAREAVDAL